VLKVKINKITKWVSLGVLTVIAINYVTWIANEINERINSKFNIYIDNWTTGIMPVIFLALDCLVLLVGLAWICKNLKKDKEFRGNTKWMTAHFILLVLTLVSFIIGPIFGPD
jgi:thiosulfate reductase cytochrome b subunit